MLYYLIYISKAKKLMQEDELIALLNESRNWNSDHELTGMLLYVEGRFIEQNEGRFMQVLEGDEREVKLIFEKIKTDFRHFQLIVLETGAQAERIFNNWTMGFKMIDLESLKQVPGYFRLTGDALSGQQNENARPMLFLKSFYNTNEEFASTYPYGRL
jgi:hypothetical protein